ncbi:hypothetical protein Cgig2_029719 [Carnegiea gigantea]|uniref:Methyltransferase type 11 domain-containing protein n=1 Tax=Carnegiea gigantea TaxID=171969 RepID=A0A9Q1K8A5_9CARY|nr:hypothetical protein Cgig2_029719 [Carnegiea gigantea]
MSTCSPHLRSASVPYCYLAELTCSGSKSPFWSKAKTERGRQRAQTRPMGFTMSLNFLLLVAVGATNILSLYHLSSTSFFLRPKAPTTPPPVPDHLVRQLHTIRATFSHLTRFHPAQKTPISSAPSDLLSFSRISPIASPCHDYPELLYQYMNYTPWSLCPKDDAHIAESLILRGCHPLPRRRCFSRTPLSPKRSDPDSNVIWSSYPSSCKSFKCLNPKLGFDFSTQNFMFYKSELDLTIPQLMDIAKRANSVIRLGIDIGGGTGNFAVAMRQRNVTILTTTMNFGAPYSEANAVRGMVPLHAQLQQRLPVFDGAVDLVRCGHAVNRWIPVPVIEFLFSDMGRMLRGGGFLWIDHFFSKEVDFENLCKPLIMRLGYKVVKWATGQKTDTSGIKNREVYLTALMQKPKSRCQLEQYNICLQTNSVSSSDAAQFYL